MKITFLGTAAATACPLVFCSCPVCEAGWRRGGKDLRLRSSALIDDRLLIDLGPDLMASAFRLGIDVRKIGLWLQTHAHSDHFDAGHLITRWSAYASEGVQPLELVASKETISEMSGALALEEGGASLMDTSWLERLRVNPHPIRHGETICVSGYGITAIESNHDPDGGSLLYVISDGKSAFLYATDTMRLTEPALEALSGFSLDAAALDHTYGPGIDGGGHLNAEQFAEEIQRLRSLNILKPNARVYATHISHEGMLPHDELMQYARQRGYEPAYDGLTIWL